MGLLQEVAGHPVAQQFQQLGLGSQVGIVLGGIVVLSVILNIANQILSRNPNEPPMVFHWFPFVGSTITYGIDPPTFFKENRAKVSNLPSSRLKSLLSTAESYRKLHHVWTMLNLGIF